MNTLTLELSSFAENRHTHATLMRVLNYKTTEQFYSLIEELAKELNADVAQVGRVAACCSVVNAFESLCGVVHGDTLRERVTIDYDMPNDLRYIILDVISEYGSNDLPKLTKQANDIILNVRPQAGQELNLLALYRQELSLDTLTSLIEGMSDDELKVLDSVTKGRVSKFKYFYSELEVFES